MEDFCEDCEDDVTEGIPDDPPPCTMDTCTAFFSTLREAAGRLAVNFRLRGGNRTKVVGEDCPTCSDGEDCGVLKCFVDADGNYQGVDVDIFGDPATLEGIDCEDEDGNSLYSNPLRKIKNADGSCSLGVLPFPIQETVCNENNGCEGIAPEGEADTVHIACAEQVCSTIENRSCFPMTITPQVTVLDAETGPGTTYELTPTLNGSDGEPNKLFSGNGSSGCSVVHVPGDSVGHNVDCGDTTPTYHSGTISYPPVEIAAGESFTFCVAPSIRYDTDISEPFGYDFGDITVCLEGRSKVTAETISQLEGSDE